MSHQDHHHSQNPDHLKTSFFLHPLAQLFPSSAFPCDTNFFFLHYEARSFKELATSDVNIVINIVFGKWNLYYHGNFKMMVFFQTHHLKTITYNLDKSFCN